MNTKNEKLGTLILVRHGESRLNELNCFTGWLDVPLNKKGFDEAHIVADHCRKFDYDAVYTSCLERTHGTLLAILSLQKRIGIFQHDEGIKYNRLNKAPEKFVRETFPIFMSENLNERSYGDLQGLNKNDAIGMFGMETVYKWRRGFKDRPPMGESLLDVYNRVIPYFERHIHTRVKLGETVLVVAHGNTLRAIIKFLEHIDDDKISFVNLPTGRPLVYECVGDQLKRTEGKYNFQRHFK